MTPLRPIAFPQRADQETVESLTLRISALCAERQELRARGAGETTLEQNRLRIAEAQWHLSHALIERYLPKPAAEAAA
jgi:hypothetical protein